MNLISISQPNIGWLFVEFSAATENYFEVRIPKNPKVDIIKEFLGVLPHMMQIDMDLMESFDDAGRTEINKESYKAVKDFIARHKFRNVNSALPEFDKLTL
ncbi:MULTISPECIES: hypothetical protein [Aerosakkonema]|uniref:hypothetical protein n=1 Tax=Aerosakkonema TaxID=1246629 RepID=UPI0035B7F76E